VLGRRRLLLASTDDGQRQQQPQQDAEAMDVALGGHSKEFESPA
jgi:hypothetical protein